MSKNQIALERASRTAVAVLESFASDAEAKSHPDPADGDARIIRISENVDLLQEYRDKAFAAIRQLRDATVNEFGGRTSQSSYFEVGPDEAPHQLWEGLISAGKALTCLEIIKVGVPRITTEESLERIRRRHKGEHDSELTVIWGRIRGARLLGDLRDAVNTIKQCFGDPRNARTNGVGSTCAVPNNKEIADLRRLIRRESDGAIDSVRLADLLPLLESLYERQHARCLVSKLSAEFRGKILWWAFEDELVEVGRRAASTCDNTIHMDWAAPDDWQWENPAHPRPGSEGRQWGG